LEDLYLGELVTALFYLAAGLRLRQLPSRTPETPERLLGVLFLVTGTSYFVYWIPIPALWTPLAFAGRLLYLPAPVILAHFTRRAFRTNSGSAAWLVHATAALLVVGVTGSVLSGDLEGFSISNPWFWPEWLGQTLPFAWAGGEALRHYAATRPRVRLGLCEPLVSNRFLLWGSFGALQVVASLAVLGQYGTYERDGVFTLPWELLMGAIEVGSLAPIWLAFFPPLVYQRWVGVADSKATRRRALDQVSSSPQAGYTPQTNDPDEVFRQLGTDNRRFVVTLASQGAIAIQNLLADGVENLTLEQKVEKRTEELKTTQRRLAHQEKMASIGELVAGVAHEINNPLNFIQGNLFHLRECTESLCAVIDAYEVALRSAPGDGSQTVERVRKEHHLECILSDLGPMFEGCEEGVRRTTTIVKDLRTFSRMDSGRPTRLDVRDSLNTALNLARGHLIGIDINRRYADVPAIECLTGQIDQVFINLVVNAADAMGESGTLGVRVSEGADDTVVVEIEDDGMGISDENLHQIFEPFFTTKVVGAGTGLGLAISYGIVDLHGGRIEVESEEGRGTLFRVHLPVQFSGTSGS
jgi:signal transduction histidine kinase